MHIIATDFLPEEKIKKYANGQRGFIVFNNAPGVEALSKNLESHGFKHIDLGDVLLNCRPALRQTVIDFTGELNCRNPHSNWWANNLSRRVAMYDLPTSLAKLFLLREVIDKNDFDCIIVIDSSCIPWFLLKDGNHKLPINFTCIHNIKNPRHFIEEHLPVRIILWSIRKIIHRFVLTFSCERQDNKPLDGRKAITLLTLINHNCFPKGGSFRDIYLGELASKLEEKRYPVCVLARILGTISADVFRGLRRNKNSNIECIDSYWTFQELLKITIQAIKDFYSPSPDWELRNFMGFDIGHLLSHLWHIGVEEPVYVDALLDGCAINRYFKKIPTNVLIYPYENKTYERIVLQEAAATNPKIYTAGYQHAVLTPKHIYMFRSEGEAKIMPLPDRIVTNGPWTAKMFRERGRYPNGKIATGTALRFSAKGKEYKVRQTPPRKIHNVLVALAEGAEEYNKAFAFLRTLQESSTVVDCSFRVRLHPSIPYDPFKKQDCGKNCRRDTEASLDKSLESADIMLYASTSVAVQAMYRGIPVVWMDLLDFWGTDPVEGDDLLHWELVNPTDWDRIVKCISSLSDIEFQKRLNNSIDFAKNYFCQNMVDVSVFLPGNA